MNKKAWIIIETVAVVLALIVLVSFATFNFDFFATSTFGEKSDMAFIINRTNRLDSTSIKKEIKEVYGWEYPGYYSYANSISKFKIRGDYITDDLLDTIINKNNYIGFSGKIISRMWNDFLIERSDGNYLYRINEQDDKFTISGYIKTPCSRIVCYIQDYLCCTTSDNDVIYMYPAFDLKNTPKILKLNKPSFISSPERDHFRGSLYIFDGQFLTHYNDDGSVDGKVKLDDVPINDRMILIGYFNVRDNNEVLFYDGFNAWGISFKDKKVLWKKQIDIIGNGVDRLGCYFVPTKQGIMAISSNTGETKLIIDGDGWKLVDSVNDNERNTDASGDTFVFIRQLSNNKYEPVLLLATEGKAKVVTCEPFEGEYKGYFFLQDARISLEKSVFNFVFLTHNRVYQYSIKRPFKIVAK
ncbi:MAG: hypothetical protein GX421_01545 [Caldisericales bacterium]|nr:hypothetical protein [Caldisericales bacterium]